MKALLLVGGRGTRLRSVLPSTPKPLARVGNASFIELLVRQLRYQGIRELVMCAGYLSEQIQHELKDGSELDVSIEYSIEKEPLGTGGAIKLSKPLVKTEFLVMNGDSFMDVDFQQLVDFHRSHRALVTLTVRRVENSSRYGTVQLDKEGLVKRFQEKTGAEISGLVNAGIYVFNDDIFSYIPDGPSSLERDVLPRLVGNGLCAMEQTGAFIDIGTPVDYAAAQNSVAQLYAAASSRKKDAEPEGSARS